MPFKSKAQQRAAFAGALPGFSKARAHEWAHETKDLKGLPEHVKKAGHVEDRFFKGDESGRRTYLPGSHLDQMKAHIAKANEGDISRLPKAFTLPFKDGSTAIVEKIPTKSGDKLILKTVYSPSMRSRETPLSTKILEESSMSRRKAAGFYTVKSAGFFKDLFIENPNKPKPLNAVAPTGPATTVGPDSLERARRHIQGTVDTARKIDLSGRARGWTAPPSPAATAELRTLQAARALKARAPRVPAGVHVASNFDASYFLELNLARLAAGEEMVPDTGIKVAEDKIERTSNHLDDVGVGLLAAPYLADAAGSGMKWLSKKHPKLRALHGAGNAVLHAAERMHGEGTGFNLGKAREAAGLALVAPGITRRLAKGINGKSKEKAAGLPLSRSTPEIDAQRQASVEAYLKTPKGKKWLHTDSDWRAEKARSERGIPDPAGHGPSWAKKAESVTPVRPFNPLSKRTGAPKRAPSTPTAFGDKTFNERPKALPSSGVGKIAAALYPDWEYMTSDEQAKIAHYLAKLANTAPAAHSSPGRLVGNVRPVAGPTKSPATAAAHVPTPAAKTPAAPPVPTVIPSDSRVGIERGPKPRTSAVTGPVAPRTEAGGGTPAPAPAKAERLAMSPERKAKVDAHFEHVMGITAGAADGTSTNPSYWRSHVPEGTPGRDGIIDYLHRKHIDHVGSRITPDLADPTNRSRIDRYVRAASRVGTARENLVGASTPELRAHMDELHAKYSPKPAAAPATPPAPTVVSSPGAASATGGGAAPVPAAPVPAAPVPAAGPFPAGAGHGSMAATPAPTPPAAVSSPSAAPAAGGGAAPVAGPFPAGAGHGSMAGAGGAPLPAGTTPRQRRVARSGESPVTGAAPGADFVARQPGASTKPVGKQMQAAGSAVDPVLEKAKAQAAWDARADASRTHAQAGVDAARASADAYTAKQEKSDSRWRNAGRVAMGAGGLALGGTALLAGGAMGAAGNLMNTLQPSRRDEGDDPTAWRGPQRSM